MEVEFCTADALSSWCDDPPLTPGVNSSWRDEPPMTSVVPVVPIGPTAQLGLGDTGLGHNNNTAAAALAVVMGPNTHAQFRAVCNAVDAGVDTAALFKAFCSAVETVVEQHAEADDTPQAFPVITMSDEAFMATHNLLDADNKGETEFVAKKAELRLILLENLADAKAVATASEQRLLAELGIASRIQLMQAGHLDPTRMFTAKKELEMIDSELEMWRGAIRDQVLKTLKTLIERHRPSRKRRNLNPLATAVLTKWYHANLNCPYPSDAEKVNLAKEADIKVCQVNNWFSNKRNRMWTKDRGRD